MLSEIPSRCRSEHRSFISALFGEIIAAKETAETYFQSNGSYVAESVASRPGFDDSDFQLQSPPAPSVDRQKGSGPTEHHKFGCGSRRR
jgi:hypothetical protein